MLSLSCTTSLKENPRRPSRHASSPQPLSDTDPLSDSAISSSRALKLKEVENKRVVEFLRRVSISATRYRRKWSYPSALFVPLTRLKERNVPIFGHGIGRDLKRIGTNFRLTLWLRRTGYIYLISVTRLWPPPRLLPLSIQPVCSRHWKDEASALPRTSATAEEYRKRGVGRSLFNKRWKPLISDVRKTILRPQKVPNK